MWVSGVLQSDWLRAFKAYPGTPKLNSLQKLNHFVASMDVYLHEVNQL